MLKQLSRHALRLSSNAYPESCSASLIRVIPSLITVPQPVDQVIVPIRNLHSTRVLWKVRKNERKNKASKEIHESKNDADNAFVQGALKEMKELEVILSDELVKHFSLQVDLRAYEEIVVKLDGGEEHRMNRLGRVVLKSPQMVMINLADNPTAIKAAKLALQKSNLNVNPQQEGVALYVPVPRMTRERRQNLADTAKAKMFNEYKQALNEEGVALYVPVPRMTRERRQNLADTAKAKMFNEYKQALNEVYSKYDKKSSKDLKSHDEAAHTRASLLSLKKTMEGRGLQQIEERRLELLKEVA